MRTNISCCPVALASKYIEAEKLKEDDVLICRLTKTKKHYTTDSCPKIREIFKEMLKAVESNFLLGLNSVSSVGISVAENNSAANRFISKHV